MHNHEYIRALRHAHELLGASTAAPNSWAPNSSKCQKIDMTSYWVSDLTLTWRAPARQWKEVKGKKVLFYKIEWDGAWKDTWQPAADVERTAEEAVQDFIDRADRASSGQHRRKRSAAASDED